MTTLASCRDALSDHPTIEGWNLLKETFNQLILGKCTQAVEIFGQYIAKITHAVSRDTTEYSKAIEETSAHAEQVSLLKARELRSTQRRQTLARIILNVPSDLGLRFYAALESLETETDDFAQCLDDLTASLASVAEKQDETISQPTSLSPVSDLSAQIVALMGAVTKLTNGQETMQTRLNDQNQALVLVIKALKDLTGIYGQLIEPLSRIAADQATLSFSEKQELLFLRQLADRLKISYNAATGDAMRVVSVAIQPAVPSTPEQAAPLLAVMADRLLENAATRRDWLAYENQLKSVTAIDLWRVLREVNDPTPGKIRTGLAAWLKQIVPPAVAQRFARDLYRELVSWQILDAKTAKPRWNRLTAQRNRWLNEAYTDLQTKFER